MTFSASSVSAASPGARSTSAFGGTASGTGAGFGGGATGVSSDARIRDMGGSTVIFFFASPSPAFFAGRLSIKETLSTSRRGTTGLGGAFAAGAGADGFATGLCSGSFFFDPTFAFDAAGLWAGAPFRAAVFFATVLLVVLVAIRFCKIVVHGSCLKQSRLFAFPLDEPRRESPAL